MTNKQTKHRKQKCSIASSDQRSSQGCSADCHVKVAFRFYNNKLNTDPMISGEDDFLFCHMYRFLMICYMMQATTL